MGAQGGDKMSKQSRAKRREAFRAEKQAHEAERKLDALQTKALDVVSEIVERKVGADESRQPRFSDAASIFGSVYRWALACMQNEPGSRATMRDWDKWYRASVEREPFLAGVFNGAVQIDTNRGWTLTGAQTQVKRYTKMFRQLEWRKYVSWQAQSYYSTRMGFVSELGTQGRGGPLVMIWPVDPCACELSGDPDAPLRYYPRTGGMQEWLPGWFFRACSLVSTDENALGYGFPAVKRCYDLAKIMVGVYTHYQMKVGARTLDGILTGRYISEPQWEEALRARNEALNADPSAYLNSIATIMSSGGDMPEFVLTTLSSLPDRWDIEVWTKILMRGYELAFGYQGEFYPESAGVLGRGNEVQIQHRNATAQGGKDFILAHQGELQNALPPTLEFLYDERDVGGETEDAQLQLAKAAVITELTKWQVNQQSVLTVPQIMALAAEQGVIPDSWTPQDENVTATDEVNADEADTTPTDLSVRVQRAMRAFPDEPIVRYTWPLDKTRIVRMRRRHSFYFPKVLRRSIGQVVKDYRDSLTNLVYNAWNRIGNKQTSAGVMQTAFRTEHKRLIARIAPDAYGEGLREGGVPLEDMDDADKRAVAAWVTEQSSFVNEFAKAVVEAGADNTQRDSILARVDTWASSVESLGSQGVMSAKANKVGTWRLGKTERHCRTCAGLHGKRHRLVWFKERGLIPRQPGNEALECKGYQCDCRITDDEGNVLL